MNNLILAALKTFEKRQPKPMPHEADPVWVCPRCRPTEFRFSSNNPVILDALIEGHNVAFHG